jgi:uncharacterized protein YkwD
MAIRQVAVVAAAMSVLTIVPAATAGARPADAVHLSSFDRQLLTNINGQRELRGLQPLNLSSPLTTIASSWAQQMATSRRSHDNPNLRAQVSASCPGWKAIGEVVDEAGESTELDLWHAYYDNTAERQQLMQPSLTDIGLRTVMANENGADVKWNVVDVARDCS